MGLAKTWTNNRIEPLYGDPLSGLHCTWRNTSSQSIELNHFHDRDKTSCLSTSSSSSAIWSETSSSSHCTCLATASASTSASSFTTTRRWCQSSIWAPGNQFNRKKNWYAKPLEKRLEIKLWYWDLSQLPTLELFLCVGKIQAKTWVVFHAKTQAKFLQLNRALGSLGRTGSSRWCWTSGSERGASGMGRPGWRRTPSP